MAWVRPTVEFSPTTNPLDTPVWVDITDDIRGSIEWGYGRSSEFDQANPGQCSFILDNRDRTYDPHNTAGPYYGDLKPRRKVRITASGTTVFTGYVNGWNQTVDWVTNDALVEVSAVDPLTVLAQARFPEDIYRKQILSQEPIAWWRLIEPADSGGTLIDQMGGCHATNFGSKYDQDTGLENGVNSYWDDGRWFKGGQAYTNPDEVHLNRYGSDQNPFGAYIGPSSIELWLRISASAVPGGTFKRVVRWIRADESHGDNLLSLTSTYFILNAPSGGTVADGNWHHIVITSDGTNVLTYRDGVLVATRADASYIARNFAPFGGLGAFILGGSILEEGFQGWLRDVAFYDRALTLAEVQANYEAALGFPYELTGVRVGRLLDLAGWPTAERDIDDGYALVSPEPRAEGTALGYLQDIASVEGGLIFAQPDGKIRFRARHYANDDTASKTVQATYDDASAATLRYLSVKPAFDDQYIFNDVTASGDDGNALTIEDATSIDEHLRRSQDLTGLKTIANEAYARAEGIIRRYANPDPANARLDEVRISARHSTAQLNDAIARRIGDRVQVKLKQGGSGNQVTYEGHIESYHHSVDLSELTWEWSFMTQPNDLEAYFIVGTSTLNSATPIGH